MDKNFTLVLLFSFFLHIFILCMGFANDENKKKEFVNLQINFADKQIISNQDEINNNIANNADNRVSLLQFNNKTEREAKAVKPVKPETQNNKIDDKKIDKNAIKLEDNPAEKNNKVQNKNIIIARKTLASRSVNTNSTSQQKAVYKEFARQHGGGHILGNVSGGKAQNKSVTYERLISLWLDKFRTYPEIAKQKKIKGEGILFIKIDRSGKILLTKIKKSTGSKFLDDALLNMAALANPVIPVPATYYPKRKNFSYEIKFVFE